MSNFQCPKCSTCYFRPDFDGRLICITCETVMVDARQQHHVEESLLVRNGAGTPHWRPCSQGCCWFIEYGPGHYLSVKRVRGINAPDLADVLQAIHKLFVSGNLKFTATK